MVERLAEELRAAGRLHELFDVRLLQSRLQLGLPAYLAQSAEELPTVQRAALEEAYLAACREVGQLLLGQGSIREAWLYLRPVGDKADVARAIAAKQPTDAELEGILDVALQQGVAPACGVQLMLDRYGACNTISAVDGHVAQWSAADRRAAVGVLLRRIHADLFDHVRHDVECREGQPPAGDQMAALVAERSWLFENENYHLDTSHLHSTVRLARLAEDAADVAMALDLTEYGRRLSPHYQYPGEEPFAEFYASHGLFFAAQLGDRVEAALEHFEKCARDEELRRYSTLAAETLVVLLVRLGRFAAALDASLELLPPGTPTGGWAPTIAEIARAGGLLPRLMEVYRQRDDVVGLATALVQQAAAEGRA